MNAAEFLERAGPLLLADEARHNLMLGVAGNVRDLPQLFPEAHFWAVDGAAAMQTAPSSIRTSTTKRPISTGCCPSRQTDA